MGAGEARLGHGAPGSPALYGGRGRGQLAARVGALAATLTHRLRRGHTSLLSHVALTITPRPRAGGKIHFPAPAGGCEI